MKIDDIDTCDFLLVSQLFKSPTSKAKHIRMFPKQEEQIGELAEAMKRAMGGECIVSDNDAVRFAISFAAKYACKPPHKDTYRTHVVRVSKKEKTKKEAKPVELVVFRPSSGPDENGDSGGC